MILFPNAKINIGLNVTERRPDGFHNLESVFYPVNWCDALEILPAEAIEFTSSGIQIPGNPESNLCLKAYQLLKADFEIPPVKMHLHKNIPIGAGLGGGSADAAFALKGLNELFELNLTPEQLENYARKLGADCAFFIRNKPVYAYAKGDEFEPVTMNLSGYKVMIVYPEIHITTAEAYGKIKPKPAKIPVKEAVQNAMETWPKTVFNDFETALFPTYPILPQLKKQFFEAGARYASMTGSGSAVFGIFQTEIPAELTFPDNFRSWHGRL
ncbi:4-(cytidine 5'-diphospho)-2-C-methyl-D-erythritol kinase [Adhaeribacter sp. BT258]|uniref:4-diphosphocytidyl-2-C-methyl-D-erythritol kinase n=1 Tax=Adhaeribacter terrigena TaxID=2793070 RepID=A0ABS1C6S2_9BACT|nr:4-(cytidine 5'-diphospho)-2-C-methyl-D-erythritol kinase [Adhaeribacter terrigena]MBK0404916.1 4-(cytidine 5'-diphospho)-2-C-methyl-D-erythritol kinase [Adhaeribacter terrigena]